MICVECGSIMVKTPTGGGKCSNCGAVSNEAYQPLSVYDLGVGGVAILDEELGKAKARIAELETAVRLNAGRVYHVRHQRSLDASTCACEDCQPFDHTDPGHDGMAELARLRELEAAVFEDISARTAYEAHYGVQPDDGRTGEWVAKDTVLWAAKVAAAKRRKAAIAACRAAREGA